MLIKSYFIKTLFGLLVKTGLNDFLRKRGNKAKFKNDVKAFLSKLKIDTHLDIFLFADRQEVKNKKDFMDLEDIYIPLRANQIQQKIPKDADISNLPDRDQLIENHQINHLIEDLDQLENFENILLIGSAGSGKSTFMKYLTRLFFSDKVERNVQIINENELIPQKIKQFYFPIFIPLRDLENELKKHNQENWEENFNLEDYFQSKYNLKFETANFYTHLFRYAPCLFLLDGIDEIPEEKKLEDFTISRKKIIRWIFQQMENLQSLNNKSRFILTSRPTETSDFTKYCQVFEVQNFNETEVEIFSEKWYKTYKNRLERTLHIENRTNERTKINDDLLNLNENKNQSLEKVKQKPLSDLAENPLLLSLALLMHSIDNSVNIKKVEKLYEHFVRTFLYKWDDVRAMNSFKTVFDNDFDSLYNLVMRLAFFYSKQETTQLPAKALIPELTDLFQYGNDLKEGERKKHAYDLLKQFRDRGGLINGKQVSDKFEDTIFEFQHKSFQDYLTAHCLHYDKLIENEEFDLDDKIAKDFWKLSLEFYFKIGNTKVFFNNYINKIKPKTSYSRRMNRFAYYFFEAKKQTDLDAIELKFSKIVLDILLKSNRLTDIKVAENVLSELSYKYLEKVKCLKFINQNHKNEIDAVRSGSLFSVFSRKGYYENIRTKILHRLKLKTDNNFWEKYQLIELVFTYKDLKNMREMLVFFNNLEENRNILMVILEMLHRNLPFFPFFYAPDILHTWDLQEWNFYNDIKELIFQRDSFFNSNKKTIFGNQNNLNELKNFANKNLEILNNLTEEEKKKYFNYY